MHTWSKSLDLEKVRTVIYYLPDGKAVALKLDGFEELMDLRYGKICDTSDIDGIVHFFPCGHA